MDQASNLDLIKNYFDIFQNNPKNLDKNWKVFFEDLDEEEEESEEEYVDPKDLTKQGYKKDGFVVEDGDMDFNSDSEEEEWIPSQEENTEDSLEDADDDEEEELEAHLASSSVEEEEEEEEESDEEIPEMAGDSNDELKEEEYEY